MPKINNEYQPLIPSAFQLIQLPSKKAYDRYINNWQSTSTCSPELKDSLKTFWSNIQLCWPGAIAYPITLALAPITIGLDIAIGLGEFTHRAYQRKSREELLWVMQCKWAASPAQQLAFTASSFALGSFICYLMHNKLTPNLSFRKCYPLEIGPIIGLAWTEYYGLSQSSISRLPHYLGPNTFNILIGGGDQDEQGNDFLSDAYFEKMWGSKQKPFKPHFSQKNPPNDKSRSSSEPSPSNDWKGYLDKVNLGDKELKREGPYQEFYNKIFNRVTPLELLSSSKLPLSEKSSKKEIKKAYLYWSLIVHPDRVKPSLKEEATSLFQCLKEAVSTVGA